MTIVSFFQSSITYFHYLCTSVYLPLLIYSYILPDVTLNIFLLSFTDTHLVVDNQMKKCNQIMLHNIYPMMKNRNRGYYSMADMLQDRLISIKISISIKFILAFRCIQLLTM